MSQPPQHPQGDQSQNWQGHQLQSQPKKKAGWLKIGLIVLGVLIVLAIIITAAINTGDDSPNFKGKSKNDTVARAGETITHTNVSITATPLQPRNSEFEPAQLCTTITIKNEGDEEHSYNLFDWQVQDPNGAITPGGPSLDNVDNALGTGRIAPGGQTSGESCFRSTFGIPGEYVVIYQSWGTPGDRLAWVNMI